MNFTTGTRERVGFLSLAMIMILSLTFGVTLALDEEKPAKPEATEKESGMEGKKEVAVINTNMGTIVIEFLPDVAPNMVENFKRLARSGFYDGAIFHRIIEGFMIQGGDPGSRKGGADGFEIKRMKAEFTTKYNHVRGIVSTARLGNDVNSGSSQFFIMHADNTGLDGKYTIFGRTIEGMNVVDKIATTKTDCTGKPRGSNCMDRPLNEVVMNSVTVEAR
jgi:peptidyl-prolyl cis-trans isomerase B (cyclophilin B)